MSCLGTHFALAEADAQRLLAAADNDAVMTIIEEIEEKWDEAWLVKTDRFWDALHRCLSNGTLFYDEGEYPLNRAVLGGKHLYDGDEYVVSYVAPNEVTDVAAALAPIAESDLRARYDAIDPDDYDGELGPNDFNATWDHFLAVREFYKKASAGGRAVVFTVDP
ncbi:MAG TPA: YfbM family protein [Planctomycetota bacterium]|nr:YfbM family protein [Planctomycetota bacterium]